MAFLGCQTDCVTPVQIENSFLSPGFSSTPHLILGVFSIWGPASSLPHQQGQPPSPTNRTTTCSHEGFTLHRGQGHKDNLSGAPAGTHWAALPSSCELPHGSSLFLPLPKCPLLCHLASTASGSFFCPNARAHHLCSCRWLPHPLVCLFKPLHGDSLPGTPQAGLCRLISGSGSGTEGALRTCM